MNNFPQTVFAAILVFMVAASASAMSVVPRDFDQLVARADTVFKGTVTQQRCERRGEGENRRITTFVTFQVEETYKGQAVSTHVIELLGGTVEDERLEIPGMPTFSVGGSYVLFVINNGTQFCPLVGAYQGQFRVEKDQGTGEERIYTHDRQPVRDTKDLGKIDTEGNPLPNSSKPAILTALTAREFRDRIMQALREQTAHPIALREDD